jgi:hypothetical protein
MWSLSIFKSCVAEELSLTSQLLEHLYHVGGAITHE